MGLKDKASKIDFASLTNTAAAVSDAKQPKTAPGAMMAYANDARSDLLRENEMLRQTAERVTGLEAQLGEAVEDLRAWEGAKATRRIDPARISRSRFANRHESSFDGSDFERLKRDIQDAGGNVQPIKVRPLNKGPDATEFEIVFGHRRHEACLQLGLPILAVVDNLDDRSLFVEMERENRERQDLSPWEQGMMYAGALDKGLFSSNRQLAAALGIDHSNVGKSLALARLPQAVVEAFPSPLEIQLRWAPLLNRALEVDGERVLVRAATLREQSPRPSAKRALLELTTSNPEMQEKFGPLHLKVGGKKGASVTFDAEGRASIKVHVPLSKGKREALRKALEEFLLGL
jgi:ParB family chromosome partitioning protein